MVQPNFMVSPIGQEQNAAQNQGYKLTSPLNIRGGQSFASTAAQAAQPRQPDRGRQMFRTRERQIRENRPLDFTVQTRPTTERVRADIVGQFGRQQKEMADTGPQIGEFLPDFEKGIAGDAQALARTGQRLQTPYQQREVEPISTAAGDTLRDFLAQDGRDAFQTELGRQRAGTFGLNALDAAILEASGLGAQKFEQARGELGASYRDIPKLTQQIRDAEAERAKQYASAVSDIRSQAQAYEQAMREKGQIESEIYANRDISPDIRRAIEQAKLLSPDYAPFIGDYESLKSAGLDFEPFVDRELTFEETLQPDQAARYNALAEVLGLQPVQSIAPERAMNEDAIIQAILAAARNRAAEADRNREMERRLAASGVPFPDQSNPQGLLNNPAASEMQTRGGPPAPPVKPAPFQPSSGSRYESAFGDPFANPV